MGSVSNASVTAIGQMTAAERRVFVRAVAAAALARALQQISTPDVPDARDDEPAARGGEAAQGHAA